MKVFLPLLVRWACRDGTRDFCFALAALVGPVPNIFCLTSTLFQFFVPTTHQALHAVVLGHLSLSMCLWFYMYLFSQFFTGLKYFLGGWKIEEKHT